MTKQKEFDAFKEKLISDNDGHYGQEIIQKYGKERYLSSVDKIKSMTKEQYQELENLSKAVNEAYIEAKKTGDTKSIETKKAVELHKKWLMRFWDEFSSEAYRGLADLYVDDLRLKAYYDKLGEGMAKFVRDSILEYVKD